MLSKIETLVNDMYPVKTVSVTVPEALSAEYESCLHEIIIIDKFATFSRDAKELNNIRQQAKEAIAKVTAVWQFLIDKTAPEEYKRLNNPHPPEYSSELRKVTYTIAEKEFVKLRNEFKATTTNAMINALQARLAKEGGNK